MIDKILTKILLLVAGLLIRRKVKQYIKFRKGNYGMKVVTSMEGLSVKIVANERKPIFKEGDRIFNPSSYTELDNIADVGFEIGKTSCSVEMTQDEYIFAEEKVQFAAKEARDNIIIPILSALKPAVVSLFELGPQTFNTLLAEKKARIDKEVKAEEAKEKADKKEGE
jgi:hypothetical protein